MKPANLDIRLQKVDAKSHFHMHLPMKAKTPISKNPMSLDQNVSKKFECDSASLFDISEINEFSEVNATKEVFYKCTKEKNRFTSINFKGENLDLSRSRLYNLDSDLLLHKNIITLDLRHNKLSKLPKFNSSMKHLSKVRLDHNQFTSFPTSLFGCQLLKTLTMTHNFITCVPQGIKELCHLQTFHLSKNPLRQISKDIKMCTSINDICLDWIDYINFKSTSDNSRVEEAKNPELWMVIKQVLYFKVHSQKNHNFQVNSQRNGRRQEIGKLMDSWVLDGQPGSNDNDLVEETKMRNLSNNQQDLKGNIHSNNHNYFEVLELEIS